MSRDEIVLMLLSTGPVQRSQLVVETGWGIVETNEVVDRMLSEGKVARYPDHGANQHASKRVCLPALRAEVLGLRKAHHRRTGARA